MENLISKLEEIKAQKEQELTVTARGSYDYAVLEEVIESAELAIEACNCKDEEVAISELYSVIAVRSFDDETYKHLKEYLQSFEKVVFLDTQTNEYHAYESVESLAEILIEDWLTNDGVELPTFKDEEDKLEFYKYIIELYEYEKAEVA